LNPFLKFGYHLTAMTKYITFLLLSGITMLTGCTVRSYYLSPFNASSNPYQAKPLVSDSSKSATYLTGSLYRGSANYHSRDDVFSAQGGIQRGHTFKNIQASYGLNAFAGTYKVHAYDTMIPPFNPDDSYVNFPAINAGAGRNHYEGLALNGSINGVLPFGNGNEWRFVGVETVIGKEYGKYASFRKDLPDSAANAIYRDDRIGSWSVTSELIMNDHAGSSFGLKLAIGRSFYRTDVIGDAEKSYIQPSFFSFGIHYIRRKPVYYLKYNASDYSSGIQLGVNYRIGK